MCATESEDQPPTQGSGQAVEEIQDYLPGEEALYYTPRIASSFNADSNTLSNIHTIYCAKPKSIKELDYQAEKSIHYTKNVSNFALCVDIGAPKLVIEQRTLKQLLHGLSRRSIPKYRSNGTSRFVHATSSSCVVL